MFDSKRAQILREPDKSWLKCQFKNENKEIKRPNELEREIDDPPAKMDEHILNKVLGSMIGLALGDALGAHVEFRPHDYLEANPVRKLEGGGTWGLEKGQFTDDTSMALCLATSLIAQRGFVPYDQLVRYKWWYQYGYMSSTGKCFDIGSATKQSLITFERNQKDFASKYNIPIRYMDFLSHRDYLKIFNIYCGEPESAGNGALMRLAPVPLFFYRDPKQAVEYAGISGKITHDDVKAYDACRYYAALIVGAIHNIPKKDLLNDTFYKEHKEWFGNKDLHPDIQNIVEGSFKKSGGYKDGIRGKGYIVSALQAALWAFWSDEDSFEKGALKAVNLGDDTDTTAAIYGQLAGAYYGFDALPQRWAEKVYANKFIKRLSKWIVYEGENWSNNQQRVEEPAEDFVSIGRDMSEKTRPRRDTVTTFAYHIEKVDPTQYDDDDDDHHHHHRHKATEHPSVIPKSSRRISTDMSDNYQSQAGAKLAPPNAFPSDKRDRRVSHHYIFDVPSKSTKD